MLLSSPRSTFLKTISNKTGSSGSTTGVGIGVVSVVGVSVVGVGSTTGPPQLAPGQAKLLHFHPLVPKESLRDQGGDCFNGFKNIVYFEFFPESFIFCFGNSNSGKRRDLLKLFIRYNFFSASKCLPSSADVVAFQE